MSRYTDRVWLNPKDHEATGSVVAFHGETERHKGRKEVHSFLEVADCNGKVSLHKAYNDSMQDFVDKLRLLARVISRFADYLEWQDDDKS
jgi:hypothetical protein